MADDLKQRIEKWAGNTFIGWYNKKCGTRFEFRDCGVPPTADLVYADGAEPLYIEVTGTFYGQDGARFEGMNARDLPNAPDSWSSMKADGSIVSVDAAFLEFIRKRLQDKSTKSYSETPLLLVYHVSRLLGSDGISRMVDRVSVPANHPFSAIYLLADLPDDDPEGRFCVKQLA